MFPHTTERAKTVVDQVGRTDRQMTYFLSSRATWRVWCCCHERIVSINNVHIEGREKIDFGNRRSSMQGLRILHGAMWLK